MPKQVLFVTALALMDGAGRVLLAQRPEGKDMAGLWEFPGGKAHPNETPEEALVREIEEELGLVLEKEDLAPLSFASHDYPNFHLFMPLYLCKKWRGEPKSLEDQAIEWVPLDRLGQYKMPPADIPLVQALQNSNFLR